MAEWNAISPDDDTYLANLIHTQIQADKTLIGERMSAYDGTIHAHHANDNADSGIHEASLVGWVKVHATEAAMNTWASGVTLVEGSIHYCTAEGTLYLVDETISLLKVYPVDHLLLTDKDSGDDHNYQEIDISKEFTGDVKVASLTVNDVTGGLDADPLDETAHAAQDWETAHSAASCHGDHIAADALDGEDVCVVHTTTGAAIALAVDTYSWPWHAGDGSTSGFAEFRCYDTGFGFYDGGWVDGTTNVGKFKL